MGPLSLLCFCASMQAGLHFSEGATAFRWQPGTG